MTLPNWWAHVFTELQRLAGLLERKQPTVDTAAGLHRAVSAARSVAPHNFRDDNGRRYRRIRLSEIPIIHPDIRGLHPPGAKLHEAAASALFECWEDVTGYARFGDEYLDRIRTADVQVRVRGVVSYGDKNVLVEDHWRIDTHRFESASVDPHPWTHYQRGGHAQDNFSSGQGFLPGACLAGSVFEPEVSLRALLQTPAPRVACPPLDPICAIDFVLAQHNGRIWNELWGDPDYAGLMLNAQDRLWKPWFDRLSDRNHRRILMPFYGPPKPG